MKNNLFRYILKKNNMNFLWNIFLKFEFFIFLTWIWEKRVLILNRVTGFCEFHRFLTGFAGLTQIRFLLQLETGKKAESRSDRSGFQNTAKRGCPLHISIWKKNYLKLHIIYANTCLAIWWKKLYTKQTTNSKTPKIEKVHELKKGSQTQQVQYETI